MAEPGPSGGVWDGRAPAPRPSFGARGRRRGEVCPPSRRWWENCIGARHRGKAPRSSPSATEGWPPPCITTQRYDVIARHNRPPSAPGGPTRLRSGGGGGGRHGWVPAWPQPPPEQPSEGTPLQPPRAARHQAAAAAAAAAPWPEESRPRWGVKAVGAACPQRPWGRPGDVGDGGAARQEGAGWGTDRRLRSPPGRPSPTQRMRRRRTTAAP